MSTTFPLETQIAGRGETVPQVTTALKVETPENVILNYQLAGPAARCGAFLIDLLVRLVILFIALMVLCVGAMSEAIVTQSVLASLGLFQVFYFVLDWSYFVLLEWWWGGKSVGKHAVGIRVIDRKGYPISFWKSALRNFVRVADSLPFQLYGVGFLTILLTRRGQRLGDLFVGTVVITERSVHLPREPIILERIQPLPHTIISSSFRPEQRTLAAIEQFLGRRHVLTHERGHALAAVLASCLAERMEYRGEAQLVQQYPMAFLARVYVTYYKQADEEEESFEQEFGDFDSRIQQPAQRRRGAYR